MTKYAKYEGTRVINTYFDLYFAATGLLKLARNMEMGRHYTTMASILLYAFSFEAYLNHVGAAKINYWDEIESIRVMNKYSTLCNIFNIKKDPSRRPYQTLTSLFKFRNVMAHGKSDILTKTEKVPFNSKPQDHTPKPFWEEYSTIENAERVRDDIGKIITEISEKAGIGNQPLLAGGITESSMSAI